MNKWFGLFVSTAMLAGCGSHVGLARPELSVGAPSARTQAVTSGKASTPTLISNNASSFIEGSKPEFDIAPFQKAAGLIRRFETLTEQDVNGYHGQLLPIDTNIRAYNTAHQWADDAKQVYVGWGFWKTTVLGQTQHFFYSPRKKKKLVVTYKLVTWKVTTQEEDAPNFELANKILKGANDGHNYDGRRAHDRAKQAGYTPTGRNQVGVFIHPLVLGPLWVWLDNEDHQYPLLAVDANSGDIIRDGLKMMAIRYMFQQK